MHDDDWAEYDAEEAPPARRTSGWVWAILAFFCVWIVVDVCSTRFLGGQTQNTFKYVGSHK